MAVDPEISLGRDFQVSIVNQWLYSNGQQLVVNGGISMVNHSY